MEIRPKVLYSIIALAGLAVLAGLSVLASQASRGGADFAGHAGTEAPKRELFRHPFSGATLLPSTYLNYEDPTPRNKKSWFTKFDPKQSAHSTFFCVQRTQFGYLGLQQTHTIVGTLMRLFGLHGRLDTAAEFDGIVIFSTWNTATARCEVLQVGAGAYGDAFGGEGTGCQIKLQTLWDAVPHSFVTTHEDSGDRIILKGYWSDPDTVGWKLIGAIAVAREGRQFGEGGMASFIEQFRAVDAHETRMAEYGPQFVETTAGEWVPIRTARFKTTSSPAAAITVGAVVGGNRFIMGLTGSSAQYGDTPEGTILRLSYTTQAHETMELQSWIRARATGTLPKGCTDGNWDDCIDASNSFIGLLRAGMPHNWLQALIVLSLLVCLVMGVVAVLNFCGIPVYCSCCGLNPAPVGPMYAAPGQPVPTPSPRKLRLVSAPWV